MGRTTMPVFPRAQARLAALGARLREARLRRRISQHEMSARVGVSRETISRLEHGDARVNVAALVRVLTVLGLDAELDALAATDEVGRRLQDLALGPRPRGRRRSAPHA